MFDEPVRNVMRLREVLKAAPETLVSEAAKLMAIAWRRPRDGGVAGASPPANVRFPEGRRAA